jgi:hypothetical protein
MLPPRGLSQLSVSGLADGGLTPMTKTKVTRIIRIVFLFWLVVLIALVLTTIVALLPLPDQIHGHGHEKTWKESFAIGEWTSTVLTAQCAVLVPSLELQRLLSATLLHIRCLLHDDGIEALTVVDTSGPSAARCSGWHQ